MIAVALALIGALLFALSATLTKLVTAQLAHVGIVGTAGYWPAYALAAVALTGLVLEQAAFSSGSFPAAMAAITITDPLLSYGFSVAGFGEPLPWGSDLGFSVAGLCLLVAGVIVLVHSPLLATTSIPTPGQNSPDSIRGARRGLSS